jgi:drug/metabolite transporter (DMT)-like permease
MLSEYSVQLRIIWRFTFLLIAAFPWFLKDLLTNSTVVNEAILSFTIKIAFAALFNCASIYLIYFSATKTYVAHTVLLCSIAPTFIAAWKIARGIRFTIIDYVGIGANVFGAYLCCCEGPPELPTFIVNEPNSIWHNFGKGSILIGDFCAMASSAIFAIYLTLSDTILKEKNCPRSYYIVVMSITIIAVSYVISFIHGEKIQLVSLESTGVFQVFSTK